MKLQKSVYLIILLSTIASFSACAYTGEKLILDKFASVDLPTNITDFEDYHVKDYTINLTYQDFIANFKLTKDAVVYFGSEYCHHCTTVKPSILNYISSTCYALSYFTFDDTTYTPQEANEIITEIRDVYREFDYATPQLFIIKSGKMIKSIYGATSVFKNTGKFANLMNQYLDWSGNYL